MKTSLSATKNTPAVAGIYKDGIFQPLIQFPRTTVPKMAILLLLEDVPGMEEDLTVAMPPTRDKRAVITAFKKTGKYSEKFLNSLEKRLSRSSYFNV